MCLLSFWRRYQSLAFSPGMSYRLLFITLVREEELFQRLLLGLFHYNNSYYTGQEINKRVLPTAKSISSNYILKNQGVHSRWVCKANSSDVRWTWEKIAFITWPSYTPSLLGLPWPHIRAAQGIIIPSIHQS